jgi:hypothetical protein
MVQNREQDNPAEHHEQRNRLSPNRHTVHLGQKDCQNEPGNATLSGITRPERERCPRATPRA